MGWTASDQNCRANISKRQARGKGVFLFDLFGSGGRRLRRATLAASPLFESEARTALLRHFHAILADFSWDHRDAAEVEVNVIVDADAGVVTIRHHRHVVAQLLDDIVVLFDQLLRFEDGVWPDAIGVRG